MPATPVRTLVMVLLLAVTTGCETMGYYRQAVGGHLELMLGRRSVDAVLADQETPAALRDRLHLTGRMLAFAEETLALPASRQYRHYTPLDRDAVVYNVMAAPRFGFEPMTWCFLVAGCVTYRGYFDPDRARRTASALADAGWDVHVSGVAAYSTLGWFADPLHDAFLWWDESDLAELLFHELAHARVYVPGDTAFNESYATFVGREGARRWLDREDRPQLRDRWQARIQGRERFVAFVLEWREKLAQAYEAARGLDLEEREDVREQAWARMRRAWIDARPEAAARYDEFFLAEPSNARLNAVADYNGLLPAFGALFAAVDGDFTALHRRVETLASKPAAAREEALAKLLADARTIADQDSSR